MTIQDLGSIGEVVGAVATVATLIYLAVQIRANTNAMRSAAAQSVHEAFATWYRMLASDAHLSQDVMRRDPHASAKPMGAFSIQNSDS